MRPKHHPLAGAGARCRARRLLLAALVLPTLLVSIPSGAQSRTAAAAQASQASPAAAAAARASQASPGAAPTTPPSTGAAGAPAPSAGQPGAPLPPTVTIETVRGQRPKIKLAIPGFHAV